MRKTPFMLLTLLLVLFPWLAQAQNWQSSIVYENEQGRLEYVADEEGNVIPDFSHAGYKGGGVELPTVEVVHTISPVEGDNTAHIQAAIDLVSEREPDGQGIRGALLFEAGIYEVNQMLHVRQSGVVLRGLGNGVDSTSNTIIRRVGNGTDPVIRISSGISSDAWAEVPDTRSSITSLFVPVGSRTFTVDNPELYNVGDQIVVLHPITEEWLVAIDGGGTDTDPPWDTSEFDIAYTRRIERVQGDSLFIDAPVFNHLDGGLVQSYLYKRDNTGEIQEVGIEHIRVAIETSGPLAEDHAETAIEFVHVANAWVRQVTALHFVYAGIDVRRSIHVTVTDSEALEPHSEITGARRYNFAVYRSQLVLFENNLATEGRHNYVGNGEAWDSGIVFLNNRSQSAYTSSEPHRHWGQGFLYDNHVEVDSPPRQLRLRLGNRGSFGTGHGWSAVHSVAWNCKMNGARVSVEKPPTAQNYAIGCEGDITGTGGSFRQPAGYIEGSNRPGLYPNSLYRKQLADRLGISLPTNREKEAALPDTPTLSIDTFPNPFIAQATIRVHLKESGHLKLEVFDLAGRKVETIADTAFPAGIQDIRFSNHSGSGVYLVRAHFSGPRVEESHYTMLTKIHR